MIDRTDPAHPGHPADAAGLTALGDWRRRVADGYAEVRRTAVEDPERAWRGWGALRDELFARHPSSPLDVAARASFEGLPLWPYDPAWRLRGAVRALDEPEALGVAHSGEDATPFLRLGEVTFTVPGGDERALDLYWLVGYGGGLFLPFRDATSGTATYGGGRYLLDQPKSADLGGEGDDLVLDFNFAYHPSCAHDPRWSCPLALPGSGLDVEVRAGERLSRSRRQRPPAGAGRIADTQRSRTR